MAPLFDSHAHISDRRFDGCRDEVVFRIREKLAGFMEIGADMRSSFEAAACARKYDECWAAVGVHPADVDQLSDEALSELRRLAAMPKVRAIGEIGLDYHYDDGLPEELQQLWFRRQLDLALELGMPVCVHSRDADEDTMRILKESGCFSKERARRFAALPDGGPDARVLMHCFSGSAELAAQYVKLGASISLAGPVTFKNAKKAVKVAEQTPLCRLLIETDCPYMAPEPHRGETNEPSYVEFVARKIAEIKGISFEEAAQATFENAVRFYGIDHPALRGRCDGRV